MRFSQLPVPARAYVLSVYAVAATRVAAQRCVADAWFGRGGDAVLIGPVAQDPWLFPLLIAAATVAHSFPVSAPGSRVYHVSLPFFVVAVIVLPPEQVSALVIAVHVGEWLWMRRRRSWFAQVFNGSSLIIATAASQAVYHQLWSSRADAAIDMHNPLSIGASLAALPGSSAASA